MPKGASAGRIFNGWLERAGNCTPRKMIALNDRTRLTDLLAFMIKKCAALIINGVDDNNTKLPLSYDEMR